MIEKVETLPANPGSSPDHPLLDVPPDWRDIVAGWPHDRWVAWRARVGEILAASDRRVPIEDQADSSRPDADEIRAADRQAYEEMTRPSPFAGPAKSLRMRATS